MVNVLYLEDNQIDINLTLLELEKSMPESSFKVARTIKDAKALLSGDLEFDLAILDLNLPDGNGIDALLEIRRQQLPTAVIILTGSGNEEAAIAALKAGADDYLTKNQNYLKKLPGIIRSTIKSYRKKLESTLQPLKILYVEWNKPDIEFTARHMKKYAPHIQIKNVLTAADALKLLENISNNQCPFDVLLMDYRLPGINAMDAIKIIRQEKKLSIPIVLVTGHGNEEVAVQALKLGADDYLVKRENYLFRLPSLLTNAYQRIELQKQQTALRVSEAKYRLLAENSGDVIFIFDLDLNYKYVSPAVKTLRGFEVEEALQQNLTEVLTPASFQLAKKVISDFLPEKGKKLLTVLPPQVVELEMIKKDGSTVWTEVKVSVVSDENKFPTGIQGVTRDISKRKAAEEELLKSREQYRSFFEEDLTGDFISTVEGKLINCNPAYLNILGFISLQQALNIDLRSIHPDGADREFILHQLKEKKRLISYEHNLVRTDGKIINVIANIIGGFNAKGELETLKGYIIDDTKRKIANTELRKLSQAIEQSPTSVIITNTKGEIEYVNPKFCEVTGYSQNDAIGTTPRPFKSENTSSEEYKELWETIQNGEEWFGEFLNKRKDGSSFWEQASVSAIKDNDGKITHFLAIKEDITERKNNEIELINAKEKAEESDRLKSAFLANISHEIRTPMNGILGFAELLKTHELTGEQQQNYIEIIEQSGHRMLNIINDIVDISKIEAGLVELRISKTDINKHLDDAYTFFKPEAEKKGIQLILQKSLVQHDLILETDNEKFYSILLNLIKNALKYTDDGKIEFGYKIDNSSEPARLEFFVADTGIGIPLNRQDAIFDRFVQADIIDRQARQGAGLGLSITKAYVEQLGGKIWVESEPENGSTFYFTLPFSAESETIKAEPESQNKNNLTLPGKLKILLAEDDEGSVQLLLILLEPISSQIIVAHNGAEAIEICQANPDIDVILMDIQMPIMNGIEATKQIRVFNKNVTIIAQTAFALSGDESRILNAGCNDYLSKPIKQSQLIPTILKHIKKE